MPLPQKPQKESQKKLIKEPIPNTIFKTKLRSYASSWKISLHLCILALASFGLSFCGAADSDVGNDADNDGISDAVDVDDDNNGLIEIHNLNMLDHMRYNLAGTSYDDEASDASPNDAGSASGSYFRGFCSDGTSQTRSDCRSASEAWRRFGCLVNTVSNPALTQATCSTIWVTEICSDIRRDTRTDCEAASGTWYVFDNSALETVLATCGYSDTSSRFLCGYELARSLDFSDADSYAGEQVDYCLLPLNAEGNGLCTDGDDSTQPTMSHVVDSSSGESTGWAPIGTYASTTDNAPFTAIFDGNGYRISNLYVNKVANTGPVGLIGYGTGALRNIGLEQVYVISRFDDNIFSLDIDNNDVGGLVGRASGAITSSYVTGTVSGGVATGGLVGQASGAITSSYATGSVRGSSGLVTGGLVGQASGAITSSYATGSVRGSSGATGGLAGTVFAGAAITSSYATGSVSGSGTTGGLVSFTTGAISSSYATGTVSGGVATGGLVGRASGAITSSYATGSVRGSGVVTGGLVGQASGAITSSYATGSVSGSGDEIGSLVGSASGTITSSCGGLSLSELQMASADSAFTYTADDNITCNAAANNNAPVSGIRLFYEWDHYYYRRTGAGTDKSPHAYVLVTEGASGCDASADGGAACDGANYPQRGDDDLVLWDFGSATDGAHNSLPVLRSPTSSGVPASSSVAILDPHLQWVQRFVSSWQLQNGTTPVLATSSFSTDATLTLPYAQGAISSTATSGFFYARSDTDTAHDGYMITVNWGSITGDRAEAANSSYSMPSNDEAGFLRYNALADTPSTSLTLETEPTPAPSASEHAVFVRAILTLTRGTGDSAVIRKYKRDFTFVVNTR